MTVDRVFNGTRENLAIRNIASAFAHFGADTFDAECQFCARPLDTNRIGPLHAPMQRQHRAGHAPIIHRTNIEIKILEGLGAHAGALSHAGSWPAQHTPAGLVDAVVEDPTIKARVK